jgi:hypothetical protein
MDGYVYMDENGYTIDATHLWSPYELNGKTLLELVQPPLHVVVEMEIDEHTL